MDKRNGIQFCDGLMTASPLKRKPISILFLNQSFDSQNIDELIIYLKKRKKTRDELTTSSYFDSRFLQTQV